MVFESVVADVLNRFLGDYVENLDGSQLKLGIWGGDVVLKDLRLKDSALQDLDLPIKTVSGYLGKLVLKIPWKNLYTAPVVVLVERLHLLAVPSQGVAYNREKEDATARDLRKQQLSRYERRQQLADTSEKLKEKDDTFVEKLVTQIIKNVQVTVRDIHIRYEDQITAPDTPFALGITLHTLCLESTDNHWKPAIVTDAVRQIYKMVSLDSLSVYWNSRTQLYGQLSKEERERRFISEIATSEAMPPGAKYILGPINAKAQLKLNPKPEHDGSGYQIPKVWLNLVLEQLAVGVTKYQYRDMMELLQSMERMTLAQPYRKYRPPQLTQYRGHATQWWQYAYKCILNEMVRRRRRNWSWVHMKSYREMCRRYAKAYKTKLTTKKVPPDVLARIDDYEFKLDIVNVIMIRQKVQLEVDRQVERQKKEKKESGWFGGWFGGGSKADAADDEADIAKQFEAAMTPAERQKLYAAIDYQENAAPTEYPAEFEAMQLAFRLGTLRVSVEDEEASPAAVMKLSLRAVDASLAQRPAAAAVRVEASISELRVDGVPDKSGGPAPALATTRPGSASAALVTAMFETNPLDGDCDQRVRMRSQPVELVYHAETLSRLATVFRPPRHVQLSQLHAAAIVKLQELKETSALKMQYAIETHKSLDLEIDLMASQLVVPEFGDATREGRRLAVNLGSVRLRSAPRQVDPLSVRQMASQGTSSEDIFTTMAAQAYDQFDIDLEDIELVVSVAGESWRDALQLSGSPQHLVRPISLSVCLKKCLITDDPRLPVVKVDAAISKLSFSVSDYRLIQLAILGNSIPSPAPADEEPLALPKLDGNANVLTLDRSAPAALATSGAGDKAKQRADEQMTDLLLNFSILELCADVYRWQSDQSQSTADEMISLTIGGVGCQAAVRTHTMELSATLAGITLKHHEFMDPDGCQLYLVSTPMTQGRAEPLLSCKYTKVDRGWDKFRSDYGGVAQLVELSFSELTVQLHQAALCSLMAFGDSLSRQLSSIGPAETAAATQAVTHAVTAAEPATGKRPGARKHGASISSAAGGDIDVRLDARFSDFRVQLSSSRVWVAGLDMANLRVGAELRPGRTQLSASLSQFSVADLTPHIKRDKVLSMTSDEVFRAELQLYSRPPEEPPPSFVDLELSAQLGGARLLFTNRFVTDVLAFMQPFSATQAALAEASQTAAEAAQQAMQNAYAQAFKAKLDITMKAPVIVVPQNSSSDWAVVADLGHLRISNALEMGPRSQHGMPAVMDVMTLKLDNLQFTRGRLGEDGSVQSECLIVKPVTMSVQVTRNLSTGWYRERPEIDIQATLGDLAVVLSEQDYLQIMSTLTENLSEPGTTGLDALPPTTGETQPTATAAAAAGAAQIKTTADVPGTAVVPATSPAAAAATAVAAVVGQDGVVFTKLKFSFDWTFVGIELFVSSTAEKSMEECKSARYSLGTFGLHQLSVAGQMESDGALRCRVSLDDCVLQDTRAETRTCFPRLMEKVTRAGKPRVRMIDVTYSQKVNQDRDLQARVSSVSLILFLPYLMMLMEFFTKNMPEQQPDKKPPGPPAVAAKPATGKPQRPTTLEAPRKSTAPGGDTPAAAAVTGLLTLQLTVERPDIALVEDLTDLNTRAVVFDNEIRLRVQQTPEKTSVMGDISRIQLFTCVYNPVEREKTMNEIVSPFAVSVMGGLTPAGDTRLQLEVTDVKLHVNAAAIHLLTSISSGLTSAPPRPEDPAASQPAWTQLWETRDVHSFNFWFLQPETATEAIQEPEALIAAAVPPGASRPAHREELIFKARSLSVTVEQVVGARNVPLVLLDAAFEAQVKDWSAKLLVESSLKLELAYYNSLLAAWEPIIECVERRDAGMVSFSPWELHMKIEKNEDHADITSPLSPASVSSDGGELVNFQPPVLSIHVSTKDPLEVTVTRTCLDVLTELQESLANALELTPPVADETDAHFLIRNQLDQQVVVLTRGEYTVHGADVEEVVLDQGAEVPLMARDLTSTQRAASSGAGTAADSKTVSVKVPALEWTADIPVTRAESRFFRVSPKRGDGGDARGLLADIRAHFDSKIVTIRSCVQVENHQTVPVRVYYMNSGGNELHCVGVAEPDGMLALSLSAVYSNTAEIFFGVEGYTVSVQPFVWRELQNTPEVTKTLKCESKHGQGGHPFVMLCHGEMKPVFFESSRAKTLSSRSYRIHLRAPAVLSNLLPVELTYLRPGDLEPVTLPPGGACQMATAQVGERVTLQLSSYLERRWACSHLLEAPADGQDSLTVWSFISADGDHQADLSLGMHTRCTDGSLQMALYAPFWMINRTGKMLTYKVARWLPEKWRPLPALLSSLPRKAGLLLDVLCCGVPRAPPRPPPSTRPSVTVGEASSLIYHPESFAEPILFSFKPSSFFSKKKASVRVEDSEWSDKFSLDTVGSGGTVTCASHASDYGRPPSGSGASSLRLPVPAGAGERRRSAHLEPSRPGSSSGPVGRSSSVAFWRRPGSRRQRDLTISVQIQLSRSGLTRQVYFLPSVVLANNAPYDVQVHEPAAEEDWITVPANTCLPFWPRDKSKELRCRVVGTKEETPYFSYKITNDCLLHLKNKYGAISTSVQVDEASTIITLDDYVDGMATVRIINHTPNDEVAYTQRPFEQRSVPLAAPGTVPTSARGPLRRKRASLHSALSSSQAPDPSAVPSSLRSPAGQSSLDSHDWSVHEMGQLVLGGGGGGGGGGEGGEDNMRWSSRGGSVILREMQRVGETLKRNAPPPVSSVLKPGEVRLYTWERPTGERTLSWNCGKVKGRLDPLVKDGIEEFEAKDGSPLYWVSFLDGMQRTLMFTADLAVATQAHNAVELERIDQEITVEIEGVGLSLVNNITQTDVMYLGITSSGVVWETQKAHGKRFRAMTSLQCALLERAHQTYENQRLVGASPPARLVLDNKMEVDFAAMQLLQPNRRYLRRTFQSGLWLQLRASAHQRQMHAKLNRIQLDNQLRDSVFPVVLAPVPPPKSIAADSVPKAFVEMSVVERLAEHTMVKQFKYCKMLMQEFHVKLDQGFLTALMDVFSVDKLNRKTKELVESDLELAREHLEKKVAIRSLQEQRNFFDFLHFSPLKIHVSFSMTGGGGGSGGSSGGPPIASGFVQLLLQSVGVTLTEIQDVVFKLAYFQREHQFLSQSELTAEVAAHYTGQAVKQLYVLVLGLDVIGNPFGLVVGLTDGVSDLFYEPFQGAIQGPGEFAEGLALGVTSLFSHAVGGTAGAVSRITGTLGKGIAALTLDQDYQQKRREAMNRRPNDFTSGIAQSGRGLFMGVVDGVTGVVRKPIEGAQEEGALGFVKGVGKGMVGLFTRPTSGVVDFASGSFDAVKRWRKQTDLKFVKKINRTMDQDEVTRLRPARHFQPDRIIRPYVRHEAEGAKTLLELEKGRYATTDTYVAHAICRPDRRLVFLLTDRRVLMLTRNEIFGNWQVEWTFMWKELTGPPRVTDKGLEVPVPAAKRGFSLFGASDAVKMVPITDKASAQWMRNKMEETMRQYNVH